MEDCKDVVSFFSYHNLDKANLIKLQDEKGVHHLAQVAATRWGSLINCMRCLKESESILSQIVSARGFLTGTLKQKQSREKIMNIICSDNFLPLLNKSIAILEPIERGIKLF